MASVKILNSTYTAESLYQWDINQQLVIYGLSLPFIPEIHFSNEAMERAIVRQATMDNKGVITVDIPNSLLQKPYGIIAHVCSHKGAAFETWYTVKVPVIARKQPSDYTITDDDGEVYSFNALENKIDNELAQSKANYEAATEKLTNVTENIHDIVTEEVAGLSGEVTEIVMVASGWSDDTYSFEDTYPIAEYDLEIALSSSATSEQATAFCKALIAGSATTNTVKAFGTVPTVDIPIIVKVVSK